MSHRTLRSPEKSCERNLRAGAIESYRVTEFLCFVIFFDARYSHSEQVGKEDRGVHLNPLLIVLAGTAFVILILGALFQRFRQPQIVSYLVAGIILGPYGLGLIDDVELVEGLGQVGVVLLLFFLGMEMSLPRLLSNWRIVTVGTTLQVIISVALVMAVGTWLQWPLSRSVLLGFVISLSSTAVVIPLLQSRGELDTPVGRDVVGVLLIQDLAVIPMLIVIGYMSGHEGGTRLHLLQILGLLFFLGILVYLGRAGKIKLPFGAVIRSNHELQVFAAFVICFGMAFLSATFGLSTAMGAFLAGILVAGAKETEWVQKSLEPFRVLFVAFFFVSIGGLLELTFLRRYIGIVALLVVIALVINTGVNTLIFRTLGRSWRDAWYGGALLSQIGEFSFLLAAVGYQAGMISGFAYQTTIATIVLAMLVSPISTAYVRSRTLIRRPEV
ncbi:MAG: cation:proton antiporter [Fidelibacterota bacterium]|nr:MAG: cation:proton antiporter [Candidatus Neomarinimicrobiota bacterium]